MHLRRFGKNVPQVSCYTSFSDWLIQLIHQKWYKCAASKNHTKHGRREFHSQRSCLRIPHGQSPWGYMATACPLTNPASYAGYTVFKCFTTLGRWHEKNVTGTVKVFKKRSTSLKTSGYPGILCYESGNPIQHVISYWLWPKHI